MALPLLAVGGVALGSVLTQIGLRAFLLTIVGSLVFRALFALGFAYLTFTGRSRAPARLSQGGHCDKYHLCRDSRAVALGRHGQAHRPRVQAVPAGQIGKGDHVCTAHRTTGTRQNPQYH